MGFSVNLYSAVFFAVMLGCLELLHLDHGLLGHLHWQDGHLVHAHSGLASFPSALGSLLDDLPSSSGRVSGQEPPSHLDHLLHPGQHPGGHLLAGVPRGLLLHLHG